MNLLAQVLAWFGEADNWFGPGGVPVRVLEQLYYSGLALAVGVVIAIPIGALVGHTGRGSFLVVGLANGLRSLPQLGLLTLLVLAMGIDLLPVVLALALLAIPPLMAGAYAGVGNVDRAVVDAARGMGMRQHQLLLKVELPNAMPLLISGLRAAALQVIATAAVAAYVGIGGLGRLLIDGLRQQDYPQMAAGAVLVAVLALLVEAVLAGLQRTVVSPGLRGSGTRPRRPSASNDDPSASAALRRPASEMAGVNNIMRRALTVLAATASVALVLSSCGGSGDPLGGGAPAAPSDTVKIGSADFPENRLLAEIYGQALESKGVKVERRLGIGSREVYFPGLKDGSIDLIPEYTGVLLQHIEKQAPQTSPDEVYAALRKAAPTPLTVLDMSAAENKDAVVVTRATAERYNAKSIADLAARCGELVFGGPSEFEKRPDGLPGIQKTYNCAFKQFQPLDTGGPVTVKALEDGTVQAADLFTTDPTIEDKGFVVLADPNNNFAAQNVVPLINSAKATDQVKQTLNQISAKLTTDGLIDLNRKLNAPDKPNPSTVAKEWLTANGLG